MVGSCKNRVNSKNWSIDCTRFAGKRARNLATKRERERPCQVHPTRSQRIRSRHWFPQTEREQAAGQGGIREHVYLGGRYRTAAFLTQFQPTSVVQALSMQFSRDWPGRASSSARACSLLFQFRLAMRRIIVRTELNRPEPNWTELNWAGPNEEESRETRGKRNGAAVFH